jgi:hypothetical protein
MWTKFQLYYRSYKYKITYLSICALFLHASALKYFEFHQSNKDMIQGVYLNAPQEYTVWEFLKQRFIYLNVWSLEILRSNSNL